MSPIEENPPRCERCLKPATAWDDEQGDLCADCLDVFETARKLKADEADT